MRYGTPIFALAVLLLAAGCATTPSSNDPYAQTKRGAAVGAAVGAAAGFFIGDGELDEVLGSAAVGAGLGAGIGLYMDKQEKALEEIDDVEVERLDEETLRINFDSDILFAVDSATLSPQSMSSLDDFARVMREYPKTAILIQGYTDSSGSEQYNVQLSERRAKSVYNHLALREVEQGRMAAIGYGEGYPVADNATSQGRAQNRRVSILVKGKA
ncbi:MAG: OmpA family protein [Xanthomonadales bacterium]|jgi:outer membrane protein OmpA-like peptidoglycan-associated protein|nr:OmpA family protein [Xanthomonadales bacterium]